MARRRSGADSCHDRDEALLWLRGALARGRVGTIEDVIDAGDHVVTTMRSPVAIAARANVATFRDGKVVDMRAYVSVPAALAAVGRPAAGRPSLADAEVAQSRRAAAAPHRCSPTHERIARECLITVPSGSLSAGSFVAPVAARSSSRDPLRSNGIGLPWAATTFS